MPVCVSVLDIKKTFFFIFCWLFIWFEISFSLFWWQFTDFISFHFLFDAIFLLIKVWNNHRGEGHEGRRKRKCFQLFIYFLKMKSNDSITRYWNKSIVKCQVNNNKSQAFTKHCKLQLMEQWDEMFLLVVGASLFFSKLLFFYLF